MPIYSSCRSAHCDSNVFVGNYLELSLKFCDSLRTLPFSISKVNAPQLCCSFRNLFVDPSCVKKCLHYLYFEIASSRKYSPFFLVLLPGCPQGPMMWLSQVNCLHLWIRLVIKIGLHHPNCGSQNRIHLRQPLILAHLPGNVQSLHAIEGPFEIGITLPGYEELIDKRTRYA